MEEKKDITINELALIIKEGFQKVDKRFEQVDENVDNLALMVKEGFDKVDAIFDRLENRVDKLETGQQRIEMHLMNVVHRTEFEKLKEQVKILQKKVGVV